jgi:hypothetical protein
MNILYWLNDDAKFGHFTRDLFIKPRHYILLSYIEPIILLTAAATALYFYLVLFQHQCVFLLLSVCI